MIHHAVSVVGFIVFAGIAWLLSSNRRRIAWRTIAWGVGLQFLIGLIIFRLPVSHRVFLWLNDAVLVLLNASKSGSVFLFGPLAASPGETGSVGFILVFQVLPVVIFFAAFTAMLYHLRVLQIFVRLFARLFHRTMKISGAESLSSAANIFVGIESALVIRPYLEKMTRSELLLVLTTGMATVASSTLGIYVAFLSPQFPQIAGHLLSASILAIPASVVIAKLLIPETETPETLAAVPPEDDSTRSRNLISAIIEGAMDGLKLAAGISALLIAILGIVALVDKILGAASAWLGMSEPLSLVRMLSWFFYPFAFLMGLQLSDVPTAARLLGERVILTEVFSYNHLAQLISSGQISDPRTVVILSYALCGFAHAAAVAIFVGGTAALAPSRRDDLASLGLRALLAATLATLMTGCVAGIFSSGEGVLLFRPG
ncbi:MAG TPA: nucleoside transporter C-terminal domain-containing protein [Pyrinomonadaceae bacterium]|jgi:CNT family concentrative nucleoside transporter|nr:nucleoside transporter C-terminal domain-containing protein [Pyrinomonadaceae bacterium]